MLRLERICGSLDYGEGILMCRYVPDMESEKKTCSGGDGERR